MFSLEESLLDAQKGLDHLFENDYNAALESFHEFSDQSLCHSHYYALILWLKAYFSLEMPEIEQAQSASEATIKFINEIRPQTIRDNFFMKLFIKNSFDDYSDEQLHAEMCRTELVLFGTLMEFYVDQSLFVLLKVSYRLRTCYLTYKAFLKTLETHQWQSPISKINFATGIKLGNGIFNLMFSLLPERIMSMLSIIGFQGSRTEGIRLLNESANENTTRSLLSKLIIAGYETYTIPMFDVKTIDVPATRRNVEIGLKNWENSVLFLLFKGRINMIERKPEEAIKIFQKIQQTPFDLKQMFNLFSWEIMWCEALLGKWEKASQECERLRRFCPWSKAGFFYMEAIFLLQHHECCLVNKKEYSDYENSHEAKELMLKVQELLSQVHENVKRYAGRRVPIEKYVCEKTETFQRDGLLVAPGIELLLCFNQLIFIENRSEIISKFIEHLILAEKHYSLNINSEKFVLLRLLKSNFYRLIGDYEKAEKQLKPIISELKNVRDDKHLGPMVSLEMAMIQTKLNNFDIARQWLKRSQDYPSYALELFVQIRGYSAYKHIKKLQQQYPPV